jgi:glucose-6-phosphate 1-dehydrogenase
MARMRREPEPCVIVIFGASGDLTSRKLVPALYEMAAAGSLPPQTQVIGVSRTQMSDDEWRRTLEPWARDNAKGFDTGAWNQFARRLHYLAGSATGGEIYPALCKRVAALSQANGLSGNVLLYLSVAPQLYEPIIQAVGASDLIVEGRRWCTLDRDTMPWCRIIVEKPFGHDLESAAALNRVLGQVFEEDSIYRIDHYLGKELVQSLLVFRFANAIFEPLWNHRYIDHVQITAAETVGVGHRAAFYDGVGAIRDMIQSHLLSVLSLVAMEAPTSFAAHHIRNEKIKVIDAIEPLEPKRLGECAVLGQYATEGKEPAYHLNPGVADGTTTETYAAVALHFDNWRWAGTPFYLRTGKRMARKRTDIFIEFKQPPASLFRHLDVAGSRRPPNRIIIEIAPQGGVSLRFEGKVPGPGVTRDTVEMDFDYAKRFGSDPVEAYGPLLLDAMRGDQSLFQHRYEVEGAWRVVAPLIAPESAAIRRDIQANYAPGSWGPAAANRLLAPGRSWYNG